MAEQEKRVRRTPLDAIVGGRTTVQSISYDDVQNVPDG